MDEVPGVTFFQMDFMDDTAPETLLDAMGGSGADIVMSDMAHNTTGHKNTDHIRIMALVESAYEFAIEVLKPGGVFLAKVFQGGTETDLLARMKKDFKSVKHIKPPASRKDSSETYVVAMGFRRSPS
jgi:23S rRNA (uridine2552-2'-O)-methyltransferase